MGINESNSTPKKATCLISRVKSHLIESLSTTKGPSDESLGLFKEQGISWNGKLRIKWLIYEINMKLLTWFATIMCDNAICGLLNCYCKSQSVAGYFVRWAYQKDNLT